MLAVLEQFPRRIKAIANQLSVHHNEGPFPLCHNDFLHSNILVDGDTFSVTGIIDWEGACTVPWELVAFPEFLQAMPVAFDLPEKYDPEGWPLGEEVRQTWRGRGEYVEMVKEAEQGGDDLLSECLSSRRNQALAYVYGVYTNVGKLGFYDRVVEELERG